MQTKLIMLMKENNITNKRLAEEINVCEKQLGLKLKGKSRFKDNEMFIIAKFFKKTVEEIFLPPMYEKRTNDA